MFMICPGGVVGIDCFSRVPVEGSSVSRLARPSLDLDEGGGVCNVVSSTAAFVVLHGTFNSGSVGDGEIRFLYSSNDMEKISTGSPGVSPLPLLEAGGVCSTVSGRCRN